jgi:hypothetical protein
MASAFDQALTELYRAPLESFIAERRRRSAELKAAGHKPDATRLAKAARPSISAWAVNQLWWHAREDFDELLESAAQLRKGKRAASGAHRKALTKLTGRAQKLLSEAGHATADATLRRVSMTLSALAAAGGFEPEPPGTLSKDRDPPGFEAFGIASADDASASSAPRNARSTQAKAEPNAPKHAPKYEAKSKPKSKAFEKQERQERREVERRAAAAAKKEREAATRKEREGAAADRARVAEERAMKQVKRRELEAAVRDAKKELWAAERQTEQAQTALKLAEIALAALDNDD